MEKVLIIATLWPPNTTTGMYRTKGFIDNLRQSGYEPILLTLDWSGTQPENDYVVEYYNDIKIYKAGYGESLNKKINTVLANRLGIVRKLYNLFDKVLWTNGIWMFQEYKKIFKVSKTVMKENPDIKKAIVISDPYQVYYIGYYLNKKYGVDWIADYRDAWNAVEIYDGYNKELEFFGKIRKAIEIRAEKKWVGTSGYVTSVSDHYSKLTATLVNKPYKTIYNGFFEKEIKMYDYSHTRKTGKLTLLYSGSLYPTQDIQVFLKGFKEFINHNTAADIEVRFIGTGASESARQLIEDSMKGFEAYYFISDRVSKEQLIAEINNADILLCVSHGAKYKGVTSSKIFDFLISKKPVLCCPRDGDIVESLLRESGQGFFADTSEEVTSLLTGFYDEINLSGKITFDYKIESVLKYSRENQTKEMASLLDTL